MFSVNIDLLPFPFQDLSLNDIKGHRRPLHDENSLENKRLRAISHAMYVMLIQVG